MLFPRPANKAISLVLLIFTLFISQNLHALDSESLSASHLNLQLVSENNAYQKEKSFWVAIRAKPDPGWHFYWKYPGDSGSSFKTDWSSSYGANVRGPEYPIPSRIQVGPLVNFGYESETLFLFEVEPQTGDNSQIQLRVDAELLVCKEECIPVNALLKLDVNSSENLSSQQKLIDREWAEKFEQTRQSLSFDYPSVDLQAYASGDDITLKGKAAALNAGTKLTFFPLVSLMIYNAAPQIQSIEQNTFQLKLRRHKEARSKMLEGILVNNMGWTGDAKSPQAINVSIPIEVAPSPAEDSAVQSQGLMLTLIFAFVGGLILNLMPCVFPILTLKLFGLISKEKLHGRSIYLQSICYTLGVVSTFLVLALFIVAARAGGEAIGWGFQLQSPGFVACLSLLILIVSLNFLSVFEFGTSIQNATGRIDSGKISRSANLKSFLDGILMTTISTPCTAPFMGSALSFGLTAPKFQLFAVFTCLGLGMAAPFVLLCHFSKLRSLFPKPGPWMLRLKSILAFPLLATTIWLLWVLGQQSGLNTLALQLCVLLWSSFILWLYGEFITPRSGRLTRRASVVLTIALLALSFYWSVAISSRAAIETNIKWEPYSESKLEELRKEGRIVYVDFTAAWCITCQANKLVAFSSSDVQKKLKDLNVATLEADWTNRDPMITKALSSFGREGVPLNVIYSSNSSKDPEILPQVLSPSIVLEALEQADK